MFNLKTSGIIAGAAFILSFLIGIVSGTSMPMLIIRPLVFTVVFFIITTVVYYLVHQFLPELLDGAGPAEDTLIRPGSRINITEGDSPDYTRGFSQGPGPGDNRGNSPGNFPTPENQGFMGAQADEGEEGLGNISDLLGKAAAAPASNGRTNGVTPTGLDQNAQSGYNKGGEGNLEEFSEPGPSSHSGGRSIGPGVSPAGSPAEAGGRSSSAETEVEEISDSVDFLPDLDSMAGAFLSNLGDEESDTTEYSVSTPSPKPSSSNKVPEWAGDFNAKEIAMGLRTVLHKEKEG